MDSNCHATNLYKKYSLYFNLLYSKILEYKILPCNTYNIDKKGFIIGVVSYFK
jgi:hypothetical protein